MSQLQRAAACSRPATFSSRVQGTVRLFGTKRQACTECRRSPDGVAEPCHKKYNFVLWHECSHVRANTEWFEKPPASAGGVVTSQVNGTLRHRASSLYQETTDFFHGANAIRHFPYLARSLILLCSSSGRFTWSGTRFMRCRRFVAR